MAAFDGYDYSFYSERNSKTLNFNNIQLSVQVSSI
jgi:hypothetical protein